MQQAFPSELILGALFLTKDLRSFLPCPTFTMMFFLMNSVANGQDIVNSSTGDGKVLVVKTTNILNSVIVGKALLALCLLLNRLCIRSKPLYLLRWSEIPVPWEGLLCLDDDERTET